MYRKSTVLTENIAILRKKKKKDVRQKCQVFTYGSPKKKSDHF